METLHFLTLLFCSSIFGCIVGAYWGTADYRVRTDKPLLDNTCYCPNCHHALSGIYQIPILSWFLLHGKCHYCHSPISIRYPLVESGFLLYYGMIFILFWKHPFLILILWFLSISLLLLVRCHKHFKNAAKALSIFAFYHFLYGIVFLLIYKALGII